MLLRRGFELYGAGKCSPHERRGSSSAFFQRNCNARRLILFAVSSCSLRTSFGLLFLIHGSDSVEAGLSSTHSPPPLVAFSNSPLQAIISVIFGEYVCRLLYHSSSARDVPAIAIKVAGLLVLLVVSLLQAWSAKAGTRAQTVLTIFKASSPVLPSPQALTPFLRKGVCDRARLHRWTRLARTRTRGILVHFCWIVNPGDQLRPRSLFGPVDLRGVGPSLLRYEGYRSWNLTVRPFSLLRLASAEPSPRRTIINSSMGLVIGLFLSANISYFLVLPFATATASSTIGTFLLPLPFRLLTLCRTRLWARDRRLGRRCHLCSHRRAVLPGSTEWELVHFQVRPFRPGAGLPD